MADPTYVTVQRVLASFDFERIHKMMVAADWKWSLDSGPDGFRVPDIQDLRNQAERLLYAAARHCDTVGSGGFEARYYVKHETAALTLRFIAGETWQDFRP